MKIEFAACHKERRSREYPPVQEQLGAMWKIIRAMQMSEAPPEDATEIQDRIDRNKAKYPKEGE